MQAKPVGSIYISIKNLVLDSENLFPIGLKPCCEFCKISESGLI
jgi:hypothetical protein